MKGIVFICTRQEAFVTFNNFPLSTLYGTIFDKGVFHEIFQVGACPNLKDSSFYDRFSIRMYKAFGIFNNFPLSATPSYPIRYIFLEKDECYKKYFKLVHAPS